MSLNNTDNTFSYNNNINITYGINFLSEQYIMVGVKLQ